MNFLNSAVLGAAALIAVPVIIHFIHRRKAVEHRFAAFEFLLRSKSDTVRRFRLKSLLLLLLRILIVLCIVLGAAMPCIRSGPFGAHENTGKAVVLFDNSASMRYAEDSLTGFEAGMRFLKNHIEGENIRFVKLLPLVGQKIDMEFGGFAGEFSEKTAEFKCTYGRGDFSGALKAAAAEIAPEAGWDRLIVVSDFAETDWHEVKDSVFGDAPLKLVLAQVHGDSTRENRGIGQITLRADVSLAGKGVNAGVTLLNNTAGPLKGFPVSLFLSGRNVLNGFVDAEPGRPVSKDFVIDGYFRPEPGYIKIENDAYEPDDRRYFVFRPPVPLKTLVVDGDPRAHFTASETFFLEKALAGGRNVRSDLTVVTPFHFRPDRLKDRRVLFLCNVIPGPEKMKAVLRFIRQGNGCFISLGDKVTPEDFNRELGGIIGRPLRDRKRGFGHETAEESGLAVSDPAHPAVALISKMEDPEKVRFSDLFLLEPAPGAKGKTLLSLSSGEPLLVHAKYGKGNVFLYLSTIDMDWNNFPMRPYFLPFIRESIYFLGGQREQVIRDTVYAGDSVTLAAGGLMNIDDPAGRRHTLVPAAGRAAFSATGLPGVYTVREGRDTDWFAVNIDPRESGLRRLSEARLRSIFAGTPFVMLDVRRGDSREVLKPRPVWHYFFALALLLCLAEAAVAMMGRPK